MIPTCHRFIGYALLLSAVALSVSAAQARALRPAEAEIAMPRRAPSRPPVVLRGGEETPVHLDRRTSLPSFPEVQVTLLLTSDLDGRFARVRCTSDAPGGDLASLVGAIEAERERLLAERQPPPIVIDSGDLLGTAAVTRYLLAQGDAGVRALADLIGRVGYDLVVLGNEELALPPDKLTSVLRTAGPRLPYAAANVSCDPALSPLCDGINPGTVAEKGYLLLVRAGLRIAFVPVTRDDTPMHVNRLNVVGLTFRDPLVAARTAVRKARMEDRADLVVVVAHINDGASVPRRALQLARRTTGADLVLVNGFAAGQGGYDMREIRFNGSNGTEQPPIFGQGGPGAQPLRVTLDLVHQRGRFVVRRISAKSLESAPPARRVKERLDEVRRSYCQEWDVPLGGSTIAGTLDGEELTSYVLQVMRFETANEIAVINRGAVDIPGWPPLSGPVTKDLLFHALPYAGRLVTFDIKGSALKKWLAGAYPGAEREDPTALRFAGIAPDGGSFDVNGRDLDETRTYSVVTTQFLSLGGDGFLERLPAPMEFEDAVVAGVPEGADITVRDLVTRWFEQRRFEAVTGAKTVSVATNFPSLYDELIFSMLSDVTLSYDQTMIANDPAYDTESQLNRDEFFGLSVEAILRLDAQSRLHELTNMLNLSYAQTQSGDAEFSESKDLTVFETAYSWLYPRNELAGESPLMPVPLGKIRVETELTQGEDAPFHHLLTTGVVGARWLFTDKVTASLGYAVGTELLDPNRELQHGLDFTLEVIQQPLVDIFETPLTLQSRVDLFYTNVGGEDVLRGILSTEVAFALTGPLALTVGFDGFMFRRDDEGFAFAGDLSVGLKVLLSTHIQTF